jgi:hypothetical protein
MTRRFGRCEVSAEAGRDTLPESSRTEVPDLPYARRQSRREDRLGVSGSTAADA